MWSRLSLQRVVLLEAWKEFEKFHGTAEELAKVEAMMPRVVKKWRKLEDGSGALEECKLTISTLSHGCLVNVLTPRLLILVFHRLGHDLRGRRTRSQPHKLQVRTPLSCHSRVWFAARAVADFSTPLSSPSRLLQMAHAWKQAQAGAGGLLDDDDDDDEAEDDESEEEGPAGEAKDAEMDD